MSKYFYEIYFNNNFNESVNFYKVKYLKSIPSIFKIVIYFFYKIQSND